MGAISVLRSRPISFLYNQNWWINQDLDSWKNLPSSKLTRRCRYPHACAKRRSSVVVSEYNFQSCILVETFFRWSTLSNSRTVSTTFPNCLKDEITSHAKTPDTARFEAFSFHIKPKHGISKISNFFPHSLILSCEVKLSVLATPVQSSIVGQNMAAN